MYTMLFVRVGTGTRRLRNTDATDVVAARGSDPRVNKGTLVRGENWGNLRKSGERLKGSFPSVHAVFNNHPPCEAFMPFMLGGIEQVDAWYHHADAARYDQRATCRVCMIVMALRGMIDAIASIAGFRCPVAATP